MRDDVELRLVDPERNRFRLYAMTECTTLFGEPCLRIVWGRIGHKTLRERSETFVDHASLARRRASLLKRRLRKGYVAIDGVETDRDAVTPEARPIAPLAKPATPALSAREQSVAKAVVEAHGLELEDAAVQRLVDRWHAATAAIAQHLAARGEGALDLVDVSTLASLYLGASAA